MKKNIRIGVALFDENGEDIANTSQKRRRHGSYLSFQKRFNVSNKIEYIEKIGERAYKMKCLRMEGKSLEYIGKEFSITRERVRQILKSFFPNEILPKLNNKGRKFVQRVKANCTFCGIEFEMFPRHVKKRMICNFKTCPKFKPIQGRTPEEIRLFNRNRMREYNRKHKDDPHTKMKRKEYNRRAAIKRKQKDAISKSISTQS